MVLEARARASLARRALHILRGVALKLGEHRFVQPRRAALRRRTGHAHLTCAARCSKKAVASLTMCDGRGRGALGNERHIGAAVGVGSGAAARASNASDSAHRDSQAIDWRRGAGRGS
jgi:hypothetical protein